MHVNARSNVPLILLVSMFAVIAAATIGKMLALDTQP